MKLYENNEYSESTESDINLLRRLNSALPNFVVAKPKMATHIEPYQKEALYLLLADWEKVASSEIAPKKGDREYKKRIHERELTESQIITILNQGHGNEKDDDAKKEGDRIMEKRVKTFSEMMNEKVKVKEKDNSELVDRHDMDRLKAEISQKIKQLDMMLSTNVMSNSEPVKEILEKLNILIEKL